MERASDQPHLRSPRIPVLFLGAGALISATVGFAASARQPVTEVRYACDAAREFTVSYSGRVAMVRTLRTVYRLPQGSSSIGQRFASPRATLIVDDDFAAFVAKDAERFRDCRVVREIAGR